MIYSLTGTIVEKSLDEVIIDCHGVGYRVFVCASAQTALPAVGSEYTIFTYLNVKEDALDLYGFATRDEQRTFKIITTVSGVGPKVGLAILSVLSPDRIALAVSGGDFKAFTAASGVGPKLAQRIILELKDKFNSIQGMGISLGDVAKTAVAGGAVQQAIEALVSLGFTQSQATLALSRLDTSQDVQELIKQGLKLISGGKI